MAPPVPSMASTEVQAYSDGQLKWVIEHGIFPSGMPASKGLLGDQEMWQIVRYLRTLHPVGSQGKN
jgi:S-disulfanyl-L-cysteine oxidoreductase SoxD